MPFRVKPNDIINFGGRLWCVIDFEGPDTHTHVMLMPTGYRFGGYGSGAGYYKDGEIMLFKRNEVEAGSWKHGETFRPLQPAK